MLHRCVGLDLVDLEVFEGLLEGLSGIEVAVVDRPNIRRSASSAVGENFSGLLSRACTIVWSVLRSEPLGRSPRGEELLQVRCNQAHERTQKLREIPGVPPRDHVFGNAGTARESSQ